MTFHILDYTLELFPILQPLQRSILFQVSTTTIIPPTLGMLGNVNSFCIFFSSNLNHISEFINHLIKTSSVQYNRSVDTPEQRCEVFDKWHFLITVFDYRLLTSVDGLLCNRNGDSKRYMIRRKSLIRMNWMVIQLIWATLKKHEINNQVQVILIIWISSKNLVSRIRYT